MLKIKITRNNVIVILSILLIMLSILIKINDIYSVKKEKQKDEKIVKEIINNDDINTVSKTVNTSEYSVKNTKGSNYIAVLEIPKIQLKKGLVMSTKNFKSINYAISIDKNSIMPDKVGNFILYAHSGNSRIAYFRNIKKLNINDDINVFFDGKKYAYTIVKKYEVDKTGKLSIINDGISKYITLTTCSQENKGKQIVIIGKEKL